MQTTITKSPDLVEIVLSNQQFILIIKIQQKLLNSKIHYKSNKIYNYWLIANMIRC